MIRPLKTPPPPRHPENDAPVVPVVLVLTAEDVEKLKITELKEELKKRNQSVWDNKMELKVRLPATMANNAPLLSDQDLDRISNMAGNSFDRHAYWKFMSNDDGEEIDQRVKMLIEGHQFRGPSDSEEEAKNLLAPKK